LSGLSSGVQLCFLLWMMDAARTWVSASLLLLRVLRGQWGKAYLGVVGVVAGYVPWEPVHGAPALAGGGHARPAAHMLGHAARH
jgi:hypothetical protein